MPETQLPQARMEGKSGVSEGETAENPREAYLMSIGFRRDPFVLAVAEQEYGFGDGLRLNGHVGSDGTALTARRSELFSPLAYYVDPHPRGRRPVTLETLCAPGHVFVFGAAGQGKTTLRLAAEARVRGEARRTLIVTYLLRHDAARLTTLDGHLDAMAEALTVDLFVQVVEKFEAAPPPSADQTGRLGALIGHYARQLKELVKDLIDNDEPSPVWGYGKLWRSLNRPVIRPVSRSPRLRAWLVDLGEELEPASSLLVERPARARWEFALHTARLWGFGDVLVGIDGVDTQERDVAKMYALVAPLVAALAAFSLEKVYLKGFFPIEVEERVTEQVAAEPARTDVTLIRLRWSRTRLRQLLGARFQAGGSRRYGFDHLVEPALRPDFDDRLVREAKGSPRRLLELVSRLIQTHGSARSSAHGGQRAITAEEWDTTVAEARALAPAAPRPRRD